MPNPAAGETIGAVEEKYFMRKKINVVLLLLMSCAVAVFCFSCGKEHSGGDTGIDGTEESDLLPEDSMSFRSLTVNEDKAYGKVSNDTKTFSFIDEIRTTGQEKFIVAWDICGDREIETKIIPLDIGDNIVYVIGMNGDEPENVYEVTIRRRPLYTVSFDANGGTPVDSRTAEEDSLIPEPATTRNGYAFCGWNYDFSKPVTEDAAVTAEWNIITYKITYDLGNGGNDPSNPTEYTVEDETITLRDPYDINADFIG